MPSDRLLRIYWLLLCATGGICTALWLAGIQSMPLVHAAKQGGANFTMSRISPNAGNLMVPYFVFQGYAGETLTNSARVTNVGDATGTVNFYVQDAKTSQNSGTSFSSLVTPPQRVGAWITLSRQQLTLVPGQSQNISFVVHIPLNMHSGQFEGGILAIPANGSQQHTTVNNHDKNVAPVHLNIQKIIAMGVLVNLPGPYVARLQSTGVSYNTQSSYQQVLVELKNAGNMLIHPHGYLKIRDNKGQILQNWPMKLDTIQPQTVIQYPLYIQNAVLRPGTYPAELLLQYEQQGRLLLKTTLTVPAPPAPPLLPKISLVPALTATGNAWNWYYIAGIIILLFLGGSFAFWRRSLRRK